MVLVLKISMLLSVLYLFLNLATVVQWLCDLMVESKGFSNIVISQTRKADKGGTGLPIMEILAKAFLLRGGDDSIVSQLAVVQHHKNMVRVGLHHKRHGCCGTTQHENNILLQCCQTIPTRGDK